MAYYTHTSPPGAQLSVGRYSVGRKCGVSLVPVGYEGELPVPADAVPRRRSKRSKYETTKKEKPTSARRTRNGAAKAVKCTKFKPGARSPPQTPMTADGRKLTAIVKLLENFPMPATLGWKCIQSLRKPGSNKDGYTDVVLVSPETHGRCSMRQGLEVARSAIMQRQPEPARRNKVELTYTESWRLVSWFLDLWDSRHLFVKPEYQFTGAYLESITTPIPQDKIDRARAVCDPRINADIPPLLGNVVGTSTAVEHTRKKTRKRKACAVAEEEEETMEVIQRGEISADIESMNFDLASAISELMTGESGEDGGIVLVSREEARQIREAVPMEFPMYEITAEGMAPLGSPPHFDGPALDLETLMTQLINGEIEQEAQFVATRDEIVQMFDSISSMVFDPRAWLSYMLQQSQRDDVLRVFANHANLHGRMGHDASWEIVLMARHASTLSKRACVSIVPSFDPRSRNFIGWELREMCYDGQAGSIGGPHIVIGVIGPDLCINEYLTNYLEASDEGRRDESETYEVLLHVNDGPERLGENIICRDASGVWLRLGAHVNYGAYVESVSTRGVRDHITDANGLFPLNQMMEMDLARLIEYCVAKSISVRIEPSDEDDDGDESARCELVKAILAFNGVSPFCM
jgi:hypothetical protein